MLLEVMILIRILLIAVKVMISISDMIFQIIDNTSVPLLLLLVVAVAAGVIVEIVV